MPRRITKDILDDDLIYEINNKVSKEDKIDWSKVINKPDLADEHWKSPVGTSDELPLDGNKYEDVRLVLDTNEVYSWNGDEWVLIGANKTNLQWEHIDNKPDNFTPSTHYHEFEEILEKPNSYPPDPHNHHDLYDTKQNLEYRFNDKADISYVDDSIEEIELMEGPQGPQGDRGPAGPQGIEGPKGDTGPEGPRGDRGPKGLRGPAGAKGDTGPQGERGDVGPMGPEGPEGPRGERGPKGEKGDAGNQGPKGDTGPTGPAGPQGPEGPKGIQGTQGTQGPRGEKGDTGEQGPKGDKGDTGPKGDTGEPGEDGSDAVVTEINSQYVFQILNGDLHILYDDNSESPPSYHIDESGDLIFEYD